MQFTAVIHTKNHRDVATGAPKVLMTGIQTKTEDYRDHSYILISPELQVFIDDTIGNKSFIVSFEADEHTYKYRGELIKKTLVNVHNISRLGPGPNYLAKKKKKRVRA